MRATEIQAHSRHRGRPSVGAFDARHRCGRHQGAAGAFAEVNAMRGPLERDGKCPLRLTGLRAEGLARCRV